MEVGASRPGFDVPSDEGGIVVPERMLFIVSMPPLSLMRRHFSDDGFPGLRSRRNGRSALEVVCAGAVRRLL